MKIVHRFLVFVSMPVLLCLVVMSILLYRVGSRALEEEHDKRLLANTRRAQTLMMGDLERVKSDLETLLASKTLDRYFMYEDVGERDYEEDTRATLEETFLTVSKAKPEYASLRIFKRDGTGIVNITDQRTAYHYPNPLRTAWFTASLGLKKNEVLVSPIGLCPEHRAPSIFISRLVDYWGEPRAVASIHLHTQTFYGTLLRETTFGNGLRAYLIDESGTVVAHSNPDRVGIHLRNPEIVETVLQGSPVSRVEAALSDPSRLMKNVYLPLGIQGAAVVVGQPLSEIEAISTTLKRHLTTISLLVGAGLFILIIFTVRGISRPLTLLEGATRRLAEGDLDVRVGLRGSDEIGYLAASFDSMAENLQTSQREIRSARATLENIFDNVIPLCITNRDFRIVRSNNAYDAVFGVPGEDGPTVCYDSRPGSDCHTDSCSLKRIMNGETEVVSEVVKHTKDGPDLTFIVTARPFVDADNELIGIVQSFQNITERKKIDDERKKLVGELQDALAKVKVLSGFLPICSSCKKIRDDQGYWKQIETYIRDHSDAEFSHGICPDCAKKLYPEFYGKKD